MDLELVRSLRGDGSLDPVFLLITNIGSELGYIALLTLTFLLAPRLGRQLGIWFGISVAINTALKLGFNLPRPFNLEPGIATDAAKATGGGPGLPSGHAQSAAYFWGFLALHARRPVVWIVCVLVALLVAFSRLYLGVHFLDDVLVGLALGAGLAFLAWTVQIPQVNGLFAAGAFIALAAVSAILPEDYGRTFGVLWGFLAANAAFTPPGPLPSRILFAVGGLVLALALYFGSSVLLPSSLKRDLLVNFVRYAVLTSVVAGVYPRLVLGRRSAPRLPVPQQVG
jgi:hypothetical protein